MSAAQLDALERAMGVVSVSGVDGEVFDGEIEPDDEEVVGRTAVDYGDGDDPLFSSPGGGGGGAAPLGLDPNSFIALISQLECMAEQIEAESGEPEVGIRGQIATLRAVLQGQRAAVEEQAERLATAAGEGAVALAEAEVKQPRRLFFAPPASVAAAPSTLHTPRPTHPRPSHPFSTPA